MAKFPNFLIVGLEKSGTHWVSGLLNAHPEVACIPKAALYGWQEKYQKEFFGEVHLFNTLGSLEPGSEDKFARPLENFLDRNNKFFADLVPLKDKLDRQELYELFIERYSKLCELQKQNKKIVGESTPAYVFYLNFIDSFFPGIKKICIIRNPKDRVVSWNFNQIRKNRKTETAISDDFARAYCQERIVKEYQSLLAYGGHIHCLTYESLSNRAYATVLELLKYLEVKVSDEVINSMISQADFKKVSAQDNNLPNRERGEENIMSHYRKGIVGDWQNYLSPAQAELIDNLTGELQKQVFVKYKIIS